MVPPPRKPRGFTFKRPYAYARGSLSRRYAVWYWHPNQVRSRRAAAAAFAREARLQQERSRRAAQRARDLRMGIRDPEPGGPRYVSPFERELHVHSMSFRPASHYTYKENFLRTYFGPSHQKGYRYPDESFFDWRKRMRKEPRPPTARRYDRYPRY